MAYDPEKLKLELAQAGMQENQAALLTEGQEAQAAELKAAAMDDLARLEGVMAAKHNDLDISLRRELKSQSMDTRSVIDDLRDEVRRGNTRLETSVERLYIMTDSRFRLLLSSHTIVILVAMGFVYYLSQWG